MASSRSVLAKSVTPSRITENYSLVDLEEVDLADLRTMVQDLKASGGQNRYVFPAFGVDFGFPDKSS